MAIIFFLIGCSVFVALIFLGAFFWADKTGQHDDTYTPSVRILFEDEISGEKTPSELSSSLNHTEESNPESTTVPSRHE